MNLESLLEATGAIHKGHFRLSSGLHSNAYVQCARLLENPASTSESTGTTIRAWTDFKLGTEVDAQALPKRDEPT